MTAWEPSTGSGAARTGKRPVLGVASFQDASLQDASGGRDDVIEFRLSVEALGRSQFAYTPLGELASSLRAL